MTFAQWLAQQIKRDDPTGDLAIDVSRDHRPLPKNTKRAWESHIRAITRDSIVMDALQEAWKEYKNAPL